MRLPWIGKGAPKVLTAREGYDRWASTYSKESNPIKQKSDEAILNLLPELKNKTVLDAGCGTGPFCKFAEEQGAERIVGVDLSQEMINVAKSTCTQTEFRCGDLSQLNIESSAYDIVICSLVLGHINELTAPLSKLTQSLRSGGTIVISDFHPYLTLTNASRTFRDSQSGKSFAIQHYLHLFQDYLSILNATNVTIDHLEEPLWNGTPVVFAMRGRKH